MSPLVAGEVAAAAHPCRVLAAFPTCLYLDLGAHERVLAVLASDAVPLPIGLRVARPSASLAWGVEAGDEVVVGEGRVRLPGCEVVAARLLPPARVRAGARHRGPSTGLADAGVLGDLAQELTAAALSGDPCPDGPVGAAVRGLVGAGRGLTPSGDDALCGVLLALAAIDTDAARAALTVVRTAVEGALSRTTSISAALLVAAARGYAVPDVVRLVSRWSAGGPGEVAGAATTLSGDPAPDELLERVLAIGHSSGRDLLSGVTGALRAVDAHHTLTDTTATMTTETDASLPEGAHRD